MHLIAGLFVFGCVAMICYAAAQLASWFDATLILGLLATVGIPIAVTMLVASGLVIVAAVALVKLDANPRVWPRPVLIGASALQLLIFPSGSAIAVYTFWALLSQRPVSPESGAFAEPRK